MSNRFDQTCSKRFRPIKNSAIVSQQFLGATPTYLPCPLSSLVPSASRPLPEEPSQPQIFLPYLWLVISQVIMVTLICLYAQASG